MAGCQLCPRICMADRAAGERGFCGATSRVRVGRAMLHRWEEPCLVKGGGSGAVFFGSCPLGCVFCQNAPLSQGDAGVYTDCEGLVRTFLSLQEAGASNINLVSATPYLEAVTEAVCEAKRRGLSLPIVYNTSGYERVRSIRRLDGLVDVYLPDLKSLSRRFCEKYLNAPDYPEIATAAIREMVRQTGKPVLNGEGALVRGTLVRHLVMPKGEHDSLRVIEHLACYGDEIIVSLMSQYTPTEAVREDARLSQRVSPVMYRRLCRRAEEVLSALYTQEGESADESFIPDFTGAGVLTAENEND